MKMRKPPRQEKRKKANNKEYKERKKKLKTQAKIQINKNGKENMMQR